jgi:hypothetical protein
MNLSVKKLLVAGGVISGATVVFFFGCSFVLGLVQFFQISKYTAAGQKPDINALVHFEMHWIFFISIISFIMGTVGFVMLGSGTVWFFANRLKPKAA